MKAFSGRSGFSRPGVAWACILIWSLVALSEIKSYALTLGAMHHDIYCQDH